METVITLTGVTKQVDAFRLHPIDLEIEQGTITALVGDNGAGKSTLLKMLMHLIKPTTGQIQLFGEPIHHSEQWKTKVAYLPQSLPGAVPFTGVQLKKLVSRWYPSWDEQIFAAIVEQFGIDLTKPFQKLSQGEQQKLNLALALAKNTNLLILDEPTAHMDIPAKQLFMKLVVEWMDQGNRTLLFASHQVEDLRKLADYLVILRSGRMLEMVEKEELMCRYQRYWVSEALSADMIPGEISRGTGTLVSSNLELTEQYLQEQGIRWTDQAALELDEIISLMLTIE